MDEAHQESHQVAKMKNSYERLYKTFKGGQNIHLFSKKRNPV